MSCLSGCLKFVQADLYRIQAFIHTLFFLSVLPVTSLCNPLISSYTDLFFLSFLSQLLWLRNDDHFIFQPHYRVIVMHVMSVWILSSSHTDSSIGGRKCAEESTCFTQIKQLFTQKSIFLCCSKTL